MFGALLIFGFGATTFFKIKNMDTTVDNSGEKKLRHNLSTQTVPHLKGVELSLRNLSSRLYRPGIDTLKTAINSIVYLPILKQKGSSFLLGKG